jgi:molybdate transport system ATP-binding protein
LQSPRLLIMDEPLASLDRPRRREILAFLEALRHELRIPVLYVTHSVRELLRLADTVIVIAGGHVVAEGPVHDVLTRGDLRALTGHAEAGAAIDVVVHAHDERYGLSVLRFEGGELVVPGTKLPVGARARVRVRARDVSVAVEEPHGLSVQNVLRAVVRTLTPAGNSSLDVDADVAGTLFRARITRRAADALRLEPGQHVYLLLKAVSLDRRSIAVTATGREVGRPD